MAYNGSVELISGIKQKNNGTFPLVDASAVRVTDEKRLDEALNEKVSEPASEGTSGQVLTTDGHGGRTWTTVQGGGGGADIDDTAGAGVTNKAWSANKLTTEFGNVNAAMSDIVVVQDATPTDPDTKIWLSETAPSSVQVPTYAEHTAVSDRVSVLEPTASGSDIGKCLVVKTVSNNKVASYEFGSSSGGTMNYNDLTNRPSINSVTLAGNKTLSDLGAASASDVSAKYTKPAGGIPATDLAETYIKEPVSDGTNGQVLITDGNGGRSWATNPSAPVTDVRVNGTSVVSSGIANVPAATAEQVQAAADDWLEENISNPNSPPLDRSLSSSAAAAPADILGELMSHEAYGVDGSGEATVDYIPIEATETVSAARVTINTYGVAYISTPTTTNLKIYPVTSGKTYKVIGYCDNTTNRPLLVVADSAVTSGTIAAEGTFDYELGTNESAQDEEKEYTTLRTGYMYLNTDANCGLWEKRVTPAPTRKYYIDDVREKDLPYVNTSIDNLNSMVCESITDSSSAFVKRVPKNAMALAKVTNLDDDVTLVRSILGRNYADKDSVGDVVKDAEGTTAKGIQTTILPPGKYCIDLGSMAIYTCFKKFECGIYSTTYYQDQSPMTLTIVDPAGGFFVVYADTIEKLGDMSGLSIAKYKDGETTIPYEPYSEKTYTPAALESNPYIEVAPYGTIEFANANNDAMDSTVEYVIGGRGDNSTTSKDFMVAPNGTKFLPMVKNDGTIAYARVVPKKALFIGNSLTSGWVTYGESATEASKDFVAQFSAVISSMDNSYTFNRIWATGFEQQTSLSGAQTWTTTNIDPYLSQDMDLIIVQLSDNVIGNAGMVAAFPENSLWLLQHLRETCPKARVVWMGVWFDRGWVTTLLHHTKNTGCEYLDINTLYTTDNISVLGSLYTMEADYTKSYDVDSFTVSGGQITIVFTVNEVQYTSVIPSYTSYTSSSATQISVTGIYHVVSTYYASIHPGNNGFRRIANKMLYDLGISDSKETIAAPQS